MTAAPASDPHAAEHKQQRRGTSSVYPRAPRITAKVTKAIIEHAKIRNSTHCMIAMAIKDVRPDLTSVSVDLQTIRASDPKKRLRYSYLTPRDCQIALIEFDQGVVPEEFEFTISGTQAHVTRMSHRKQVQTPRDREMAAYARKLERKFKVRRAKTQEPPTRAELVSQGETQLPRRVGGRLPPQSNFAKRRAFGLRMLKP